jgi:hypothetical protein
MLTGSVIPDHIEPVLFIMLIMEKGRVETRGVYKDRIGPGTYNGRCSNKKIGSVFSRRFMLVYNGVAKIEKSV